MDHHDHVNLLRGGVTSPGGMWADFGSGTGAFTLALADLLGTSAEIYSVDRDRRALREQQRRMEARFPGVDAHYKVADFTQPLSLPPLDGVVMANALHFHEHKPPIVSLIRGYLKPQGVFILVEYNTHRGNRWVPYPVPYPSWSTLAQRAGFNRVELLWRQPSSFLGEIYSAAAWQETGQMGDSAEFAHRAQHSPRFRV